MIPLPLLQYN